MSGVIHIDPCFTDQENIHFDFSALFISSTYIFLLLLALQYSTFVTWGSAHIYFLLLYVFHTPPARPPFRGRDFSRSRLVSVKAFCTVCMGKLSPRTHPLGAGPGGTRPSTRPEPML